MSTLVIAVNDATRPYTFSMTSGPDGALVATNGDIDVSNCSETDIDIRWNLTTGTFRSSDRIAPVTISGNGMGRIFTRGTLFNSDKSYRVTDKNPRRPANRNFKYTIHTTRDDHDPIIRNRA